MYMPISVQFSRVQLIRSKDSSLLLFYISIITYVPFPPVLINWWLFSLGLVWCLVSLRFLLTQPSETFSSCSISCGAGMCLFLGCFTPWRRLGGGLLLWCWRFHDRPTQLAVSTVQYVRYLNRTQQRWGTCQLRIIFLLFKHQCDDWSESCKYEYSNINSCANRIAFVRTYRKYWVWSY